MDIDHKELFKDKRVLIVDDDVTVGKIISTLLNKTSVTSVYSNEPKEALEILKSATEPFALIISDHQMPFITGTEFFEEVSWISPNSIRFMITGYAEIQSVIEAVNRGEIHKYITKPWKNEDFLASVKEGLEQYELAVESRELFRLAKEQNTKLVELNRILNESAVKEANMLKELDAKIAELSHKQGRYEWINKKGAIQEEQNSVTSEADIADLMRVKKILKESELIDSKEINRFYATLIGQLADHFTKQNYLQAQNGR
ncbi:MAG: response regulator [Desulfamplus sp.]|nr:response regulator [Desulfamplus sp.]